MTTEHIAADGHVMSNTDLAIGRFDEGSKNPFFGLQCPGVQWPEGRSFARTMNVHAMARLVEVLCGMSQYVYGDNQASDATIGRSLPPENRQERLKQIAGTIQTVVDLCPEVLSTEPVEIDRSWQMPPYVADERVASQIQRAIELANRE